MKTYVLRDPPEALAVTLAHDDRAHEDLDRTNVGQGNLEALAGRLVQAERVAELVLRDGAWGINLVSENEEGDLAENERTQHESSERFKRNCRSRRRVRGGTRTLESSSMLSRASSSALDSGSRSTSAESTRKTIPSTSGK